MICNSLFGEWFPHANASTRLVAPAAELPGGSPRKPDLSGCGESLRSGVHGSLNPQNGGSMGVAGYIYLYTYNYTYLYVYIYIYINEIMWI